MRASIIKIGNSKGIRIPKPILEESDLGDTVELTVKRGSITISKPRKSNKAVLNESYLASLPALRKTWDDPREDEAWKDL